MKYLDLGKQDFSMGSTLFAVKPPVVDQLWYGNQPKKSESPFVVTYKDEVYKKIADIQKAEYEALNNYWLQQPELLEPAFLAQLLEAQKDGQRVMHFGELAKYRLHKRIPATLPFNKRKDLLVNSEEWKGGIYQHNKHLTADELTSDNIEKEIDEVGVCWGMEIMKRLQKMEWIPIAMNSGMCKVYIPE